MIAIFSALEEEIGNFKKGRSFRKVYSEKNCLIYSGKCGLQETLVALTGMGRESALQAAGMVLDKYPVSAVVSTGYGGALNSKTKIGDVVVYTRLSCSHNTERVDSPYKAVSSDSRLVLAASHNPPGSDFRTLMGDGVTVSEVCATPASKHRLGIKFAADVVDMESYWIGEMATRKKISFIAVRSIFDALEDDLSSLSQITASGKLVFHKAVTHFISHPGDLKKTAGYSQSSRKAGKNLALFLQGFMARI